MTREHTDTPPSGPWALRKPNSSSLQSGPAANLILAAFVVTRDAKFTKFNSEVSSNCASPMGPCTRSKGHFGKTTVPSRTACTVTSEASSARSQSKKPGSALGNSVRRYSISVSVTLKDSKYRMHSSSPAKTVNSPPKGFCRK